MKSITLYYKEGNSDKVYQASVEPRGASFVVNYAHSRRGATILTGTKTPVPVGEQEATQIFEKLVNKKLAKGYTEGPGGTPYQNTSNENNATGIYPQLLNPIEEEVLGQYLADSNWCMQEKHDGKRILLRKTGSSVQGINRRSLIVGVPETMVQQALRVPSDLLIDGEAVGDYYHAFDLLEVDGKDIRRAGYHERLKSLEEKIRPLGKCHIRCTVTFTKEKEKRKHLASLRKSKAEGVVFKCLDAHYSAGRPEAGLGNQIKYKFYATASCVVAGINNRRSVQISLRDGRRSVPAGNVTIPPNKDIPKVGEIIEVRYLYAFEESGSIFQPTFLHTRDDLDSTDCPVEQLKYRVKKEDDDDSGT